MMRKQATILKNNPLCSFSQSIRKHSVPFWSSFFTSPQNMSHFFSLQKQNKNGLRNSSSFSLCNEGFQLKRFSININNPKRFSNHDIILKKKIHGYLGSVLTQIHCSWFFIVLKSAFFRCWEASLPTSKHRVLNNTTRLIKGYQHISNITCIF